MLKPTSSKNFSFLFRRDGIYVVDDKKNRTRIADPIRVTAYATSDPRSSLEEAFTEIRFRDRQGRRKVSIR